MVVLRWVFMVVRSDLWAGGAMVLWFVVRRRPLWTRGGHVEVGCAVGLLQTKEKKSPERKRRTNREMNNKKKIKYIILGSGIYYFIVVVILFYCDVYIILLC